MVPCRVHSSTAGFLTCWGSIAFVLWGRISPCQLWFSFKRFCCFSFNLVIRFVNCYSMRIWLFWLTTLLLTRALKFDIGQYLFIFFFFTKTIDINRDIDISANTKSYHIKRYDSYRPIFRTFVSTIDLTSVMFASSGLSSNSLALIIQRLLALRTTDSETSWFPILRGFWYLLSGLCSSLNLFGPFCCSLCLCLCLCLCLDCGILLRAQLGFILLGHLWWPLLTIYLLGFALKILTHHLKKYIYIEWEIFFIHWDNGMIIFNKKKRL